MVGLSQVVLLASALLPASTLAHYKLTRDYSGIDFIDNFDFYDGTDPTSGHVQYKGFATANITGLTGFLVGPNGTNSTNSTLPPPVYLGVDHTNVLPSEIGRPSVRVSSVQTFNHSLILADILHMPSSTCGLWPAFWMLGTSLPWPNAGEIDIIENVNDNDFNIMTLHTNAGVIVANDTTTFTGSMTTSDCDINATDQPLNTGCSIQDKPETNSYGTKFNIKRGGIFAMEYTSDHIAIWFFPRNAIPDEISSHSQTITPPLTKNTSSWGKPNAFFQVPPTPPTSANISSPSSSITSTPVAQNTIIPITASTSTASTIDNAATTPAQANSLSTLDDHFRSLQLIFDTTFCGDWAGKVWNQTACGKLAPTCEEYVSAHPEAFTEAYWAIQSVRVFVDDDGDGGADASDDANEAEAGGNTTTTSTTTPSAGSDDGSMEGMKLLKPRSRVMR